jgi:site-specific recombinase XerD
MRALVQGLDTRASWDRYLRIEGEYTDVRTVRRTIAWLRDEFAAAARRYQRHGAARLVQVDVAAVADATSTFPSLEDFVIERGLDNFAEAEQLAAYQAQYSNTTQRGSRRGRLMARQLDTLRWLENLVAEPPCAGDALAAWLHPDLAARLGYVRLATLSELVDRINGLGCHWFRGIPAIGVTKAARIVDWLCAHERTIGMAIGAHAMVPRAGLSAARLQAVVPRTTGIVPLEKLVVPAALSGVDGVYRLPQHLCLIDATNDYEAILVWVKGKQGLAPAKRAARKCQQGVDPALAEGPLDWLRTLSHTQRAYLKEAERFLLWAVVQRQKPLSSMTLDDCTAYRDFLAVPQPAAVWCGPRSRARWSSLWRPFEGPLSPAAQRRALAILKSLYRFLADQNYLRGNPFASVRAPGSSQGIDVSRSLTRAQWKSVEKRLEELPATSANLRLQFALRLMYATGIRISEAVSARVSDLCRKAYGDGAASAAVEVWELSVPGKNGKHRTVPVSPAVIVELQRYLQTRGLPSELSLVPAEAFMLGRAVDVAEQSPWCPLAREPIDRLAGIGTATLHDQLKGFFRACAEELKSRDPAGAARLMKASAHWMRHTHACHAVASGMDIRLVQQNLGHASLGTTTRYTANEDRQRASETARLSGIEQK